MKKIILPFFVSFVILMMTNCVFADTASKAVVNVTAVRIREEKNTESSIVKNIYEDDEVEILGQEGEWYKIKYGEAVGYAKKEFFTITKEGDTTEAQTETTTEETTSSDTSNTENTTTANTADTGNTTTEQNSTQEATTAAPEQNTAATISGEIAVGNTVNLANAVKLRVTPNITSIAKINVEQGANITIETKMNNWYKVSDSKVSGWITAEKLTAVPAKEEQPEQTAPEQQSPDDSAAPETQPEEQNTETQPETDTTTEENTEKTAVVSVETARVRKSASANSDILTTLDEDTVVTIIGEDGDFYKIKTSAISEGYISKSLVEQKNVTSRSSFTERELTVSEEVNAEVNEILTEGTSSVSGQDVIDFAKQYLGYRYVSGGTSPETGFDCSGFTKYVFGHFGYTLARVAADQTSLGAVVERANLQTGDLLLFYNDAKTKIGHCGIYIGGGDFIHSANPQRGVVIDNLNTSSYYNERFVTARRIVN